MSHSLVAALRAIVSGDGLNLEVRRFDPMSGHLQLRLFEGQNPCSACHMSADFLEEFALPVARRVDPRVRKITILDDRPEAE